MALFWRESAVEVAFCRLRRPEKAEESLGREESVVGQTVSRSEGVAQLVWGFRISIVDGYFPVAVNFPRHFSLLTAGRRKVKRRKTPQHLFYTLIRS
jgi:hypothetical protein